MSVFPLPVAESTTSEPGIGLLNWSRAVTVTVVEVLNGEVTLEIAGPDGDVQQVTLYCDVSAAASSVPVDLELVGC